MGDHNPFTDRMLEETFAFARLALSNAILLNGVAATAVAAYLAQLHDAHLPAGFRNAIFRFAVGAGLGGVASMLAYLGQRLDWDSSVGRNRGHVTGIVIWLALISGASAYGLFFWALAAAASAF
jgi:hypothetical protein